MGDVIQFDSLERTLRKVIRYVDSPDLFLAEQEQAIPLLIRGLRYTDDDIRIKIVLLLGLFAGKEVISHFLDIIHDPEEDIDFRHFVSIQVSNIIPDLENNQPFINQLFRDLNSWDCQTRIFAASSLAWEGHYEAAIPLIELLFDSDTEVQQCAVSCISRLGDDRIFPLLRDRLKHGSPEQQKSILFHLWNFADKQAECLEIYLEYLMHPDADFRFDALALLPTVSDLSDFPDIHWRCLDDPDPRIRTLAIEQLEEFPAHIRIEFREKLLELMADPADTVRQAVLNVIKL